MNSALPPDPYKLLGVTKDAKLPEIRSAHRKLVLKCHPDKVQDATLKAIKQDEFQKVQQAYELLSDDNKRLQYDEQVKLFELRKEMGRGNPTPRSNPFEYEVKTAEPRSNSYARPSPKVYSYSNAPRSNEELYNEPRHVPRKSASNDSSSERRRTAAREEEKEMRYRETREGSARKAEEERLRQKERDRDAKKAHGEKKKSREKDRRRGTDDKPRSRQQTYVEDDSSEDEAYRAARASEKKQRLRAEEEIRARQAEAAAAHEARRAQEQRKPKEAPMTEKWNDHKDFAGAYMQAARRKVVVEAESVAHPGMRRAETFAASSSPSYSVRYAAPPQPQFAEEEMPKRSSATTRKESIRRSTETPTKSSSRRRSPPAAQPHDPIIVEPPSPSSAPRKPPLQSYSSAPPNLVRQVPFRAKTQQDYARPEPSIHPPPLPRPQPFPSGDRGRDRGSGASKLRKDYTSDSEPDSAPYHTQRPHSPHRRSGDSSREKTRYIVENGNLFAVAPRSHRSEMRNIDAEYAHDQGESPRGTPGKRPPLSRNPGSSERPRGSSRAYTTQNYTSVPEVPEPVILTTAHRPKMTREGGSSYRVGSRGAPVAAYENISYAKTYAPEHVIYSPAAGIYDGARRGNDGRERDYYSPYPSRPTVY
ncbi:uncharacterized protein L3040_000858 [Drepanopeziza brunnea f. sp. 'multigermtubi']|uniref:uncharacterized protein n=1 Tax=Drepanopeziza brunnea f. sp. 'multigermtubi' TaxID=698441 RepID=UPI00239CA488|nr:hypothetical protein L3040_000858 [Drepanopeziza brunnea f. sp. 'multigermtubi']